MCQICESQGCAFQQPRHVFTSVSVWRSGLTRSLAVVVVVDFFGGPRPLNEMGGGVAVGAPEAGGPHFQVEWASWVSSRGCPHQLEVVKELSGGTVYPKLF